MAPSSGQFVPGVIRTLRFAVSKTAAFVRARVPQAPRAAALETVPVRTQRQPIHPLAAIRQARSQQRYFSTAIRRIASAVSKPSQSGRASFPNSAVRSALSKTTHAPFSSPLRPNLTGGAIPRSAGGYSLGGQGVRHFSHTPAANAQVIHNVSAAVRAFCFNGFQARFDGVDKKTGEKRYRSVTTRQEKAFNALRNTTDAWNARGTTLEFRIAPTVTVLSPLASEKDTLENPAILPALASDFSRSLASLAHIHTDLKKLSTLGPLPISHPNPHTISVRFPGCDGALVTAICDELGLVRGLVKEDAAWAEDGDKDVEMALLFPWAPSKAVSVTSDPCEGGQYFIEQMQTGLEWQSMLSPTTSPRPSNHPYSPSVDEKSLGSYSFVDSPNPWQDAEEGSYDALEDSDLDSNDFGMDLTRTQTATTVRLNGFPEHTGYEGVEGIYRFLAECDAASASRR